MEIVAGCLDSIWEDLARPDLVIYDKGCALQRYRLHHPDDSWFELVTSLIVDMVLPRFRPALRCRYIWSCVGLQY